MNQIHEVIDLKLLPAPQQSQNSADRETASNQQSTGEPVKFLVLDQKNAIADDITYQSPQRPKTVAGTRSGVVPNRQTAIILAAATKQTSGIKNVKPVGRSDLKTTNSRALMNSASSSKKPVPLSKNSELSRSQRIIPLKLNRAGSPSTAKNQHSSKFTTSVLEKQGTAKKEVGKLVRANSKTMRSNSSAKPKSVSPYTPKPN